MRYAVLLFAIFLTIPLFLFSAEAAQEPAKKSAVIINHGNILPGVRNQQKHDNSSGKNFITKQLLPQFTNFILTASIGIAVVVMIIGGIMYIFIFESSERFEKARDTVVITILAIIIMVSSYALVRIIIGIDFWN